MLYLIRRIVSNGAFEYYTGDGWTVLERLSHKYVTKADAELVIAQKKLKQAHVLSRKDAIDNLRRVVW